MFVWIIKKREYKKNWFFRRNWHEQSAWLFKNVGYKFTPHVSMPLMTNNKSKNIAILTVKGVNYISILYSISNNKAVNRLNNSLLEDKDVL